VFAFDLLETNYKSAVVAQNLNNYLKKIETNRLLGFYKSLQSRNDVFGTWIDVNGDYFDTTHFPKV
jgi:DNA polymerase-3 subunit alpha